MLLFFSQGVCWISHANPGPFFMAITLFLLNVSSLVGFSCRLDLFLKNKSSVGCHPAPSVRSFWIISPAGFLTMCSLFLFVLHSFAWFHNRLLIRLLFSGREIYCFFSVVFGQETLEPTAVSAGVSSSFFTSWALVPD